MMNRALIPALKEGQRHPDWRTLYDTANEEKLPWHYAKMDPEIGEELMRLIKFHTSLLDVGTGLGNQAAFMMELGFEVTGVDISESAALKASKKYPRVKFLAADVTESDLGKEFDLIVDRGCFHVLEKAARVKYLDFLSRHIKENGIVILKVFSQEQGNSDFGPLRYSLEELHRVFSAKFQITKIKRSEFQGTVSSFPKAWCLTMKKRENK